MKKIYLNGLSNIVSINPQVRGGKACFINTRIPVDFVLGHFAKGWNIKEVSKLFPEIKIEDIAKVQEHTAAFDFK